MAVQFNPFLNILWISDMTININMLIQVGLFYYLCVIYKFLDTFNPIAFITNFLPFYTISFASTTNNPIVLLIMRAS